MAIKLDEAKIRRLSTNGITTIAGGHIYLTGSQASSSTGNTTQIVFGTSSSNYVALSSNNNAFIINPTTSSTTNQIVLYLDQKSKFPSGIDAGTGGITTTGAISATGNISGNYIQGTWLYTSAATAQTTTSKIAVIHSDNYIYYITPANLTTLIKDNASGTWAISISGNAATASSVAWGNVTGKPSTFTPSSHTHSYITSKGNYTFDSSTLPNSFDLGLSCGFVDANSGFGSYGGVITHRAYSGGGGSLQLYSPYSSNYGGTHLKARFGNYSVSSGNSWTDLKEIAWVSDIPTKISQLTNDASGTWGISISENAATASKVGASTSWLYFHNSNELNFGGSNTSTTIYFGYRAVDSRAIPAKFIFGGSTGSADLQAKTVYLGSGTTSYISSTQYTGNAATATKLGTSTVGATDRPIYLNSGTATQTTYRMTATNATATTARAITDNLETGIWYVNGTSGILNQSDGVAFVNQYNSNWISEIYQDYRTGQIAVRGKNNGTWQAWRKVLDSSNYNTYAPTKTGSGASGTWGISVTGSSASCTGNAATATVAATLGKSGGTTGPMKFYWSGQSGQPSWLWGGSDGTNMYVYNPSNFNVNSATKATQDANGYNISDNYEKRYQQIVDLTGSGYSTNTWYPVYIHIPYGGLHRVACVCQLDTGSVPSWSNHSAGFTRVLEMLVTASGWGTTGAYSICLEDYTSFTNDYCPVGYQQFTNSSSACFFCRGGGKYILQTDWFANWTIVTTSITVSSQTIAPVNSYPGVNFTKSRIYANITGDSLVGAVWNDYAEYRESDCKEFGRVLTEKGDDTLTKTTKRLQPFAGVSSDTWGFCQGETEKAKTPIAVAGRVLVYTYRNRKEYKPGDVVCAAPNGTVDIMTREEIIKYPDRIVGTVSCVPEYETWGSGDRDPVKVGNRIWIKVN